MVYSQDMFVDDVAAFRSDPELAAMFIAEALEHLGTIEATLLKLQDRPTDHTLLNDLFRPFHTIKANAGALGVTSVEQVTHKMEGLLDDCRAGRRPIGALEIHVVLQSVDVLGATFRGLRALLAGGDGANIHTGFGALMTAIDGLLAGTLESPAGPYRVPPARAEVSAALSAAKASRTFVKVDVCKIDALTARLGELATFQSRLQQHPAIRTMRDPELTATVSWLKEIVAELRRTTVSLRTAPMRPTFHKMARLVLSMGTRAGKLVEFLPSGDDTELEPAVLRGIDGALVHMVRNSIDHGIETPADRRRAGKAEIGRLSMRAFHDGGCAVIEVSDDGAGLDTDRILAKAIALGLVAPGTQLPADAIHELIFGPGLSTAAQVTEISGRGVGMEVVRRNVEALDGRIEVQTSRGHGTTITIRLPLSATAPASTSVPSDGEGLPPNLCDPQNCQV